MRVSAEPELPRRRAAAPEPSRDGGLVAAQGRGGRSLYYIEPTPCHQKFQSPSSLELHFLVFVGSLTAGSLETAPYQT